jgi:hypothetical protein
MIPGILFGRNQSVTEPMEPLISNEVSNSLKGLFESGLNFMNVETASYPLEEIGGEIIDKV